MIYINIMVQWVYNPGDPGDRKSQSEHEHCQLVLEVGDAPSTSWQV